jgi:hypothetical protein
VDRRQCQILPINVRINHRRLISLTTCVIDDHILI